MKDGQYGQQRTSRFVIMTPEWAESLLKRNDENRDLKPKSLAKFKRDLLSGAWNVNGATVCVDWDGNLLDGQHRLLAIVQTGVSVELLLVEGLDPAVKVSIDSGSPRNLSDTLIMRKERCAGTLNSTLRNLSLLRDQQSLAKNNFQYSHQELLNLLNEKPAIRDAITLADKVRRDGYTHIPAAVLATAAFLFAEIDADDCDEFMVRLKDGADLSKGSPILALRNLAAGWYKGSHNQIAAHVKLAYLIKAWNYFREGRSVLKLRYQQNETYPQPK